MIDESKYQYLEFQDINNKRLMLIAIRLREEMPQLFNLMINEYAPIELNQIAVEIDDKFPKLFSMLENETENALESWCNKQNEYEKSNSCEEDLVDYLRRQL
jgi:hypothetical protein